ncbi:glutaredoxin [Arthrobacter sp. CAN_A214]
MHTVTLLTQENCTWCEQAENTLQDTSATHPLVIDDVELASTRGRELAKPHSVVFAPAILLDGQLFSFGRPSEKNSGGGSQRTKSVRRIYYRAGSTMHDRISVTGTFSVPVYCMKKGSWHASSRPA